MNQDNTAEPLIDPSGDIVASMAVVFKERLRDAIAENPGGVTVDMARVTMIDSVGLGLLIAAHNSLAKTNGQLRLANASGDILKLLRAMRLDRHFQIIP
jgi:anti-anti-sigma factor